MDGRLDLFSSPESVSPAGGGGSMHWRQRGGGRNSSSLFDAKETEGNDNNEDLVTSYQSMKSDEEKEIAFRPIHESHTRSIVKGLTWRLLATTTTTVIAFLVIGQVDVAFQIGFFEFFAKLAIYYIHERIWTFVRL